MQITIKGGIYLDVDVTPGTFHFMRGALVRWGSYAPVMEHSITVDLPEGFDAQATIAEARRLDVEKAAARLEAASPHRRTHDSAPARVE